jgi:hypothetical protein
MNIRDRLSKVSEDLRILVQVKIDRDLMDAVDVQIEKDKVAGFQIDRTVLISECLKGYLEESSQKRRRV